MRAVQDLAAGDHGTCIAQLVGMPSEMHQASSGDITNSTEERSPHSSITRVLAPVVESEIDISIAEITSALQDIAQNDSHESTDIALGTSETEDSLDVTIVDDDLDASCERPERNDAPVAQNDQEPQRPASELKECVPTLPWLRRTAIALAALVSVMAIALVVGLLRSKAPTQAEPSDVSKEGETRIEKVNAKALVHQTPAKQSAKPLAKQSAKPPVKQSAKPPVKQSAKPPAKQSAKLVRQERSLKPASPEEKRPAPTSPKTLRRWHQQATSAYLKGEFNSARHRFEQVFAPPGCRTKHAER